MSGDDDVRDADGREDPGPRGDADGPDREEREGREGGAGDGDVDGDGDGDGDRDGDRSGEGTDRDAEEPSGTAELTAFIAATYPDRGLDGERRERLRERVADLRERGERLRAVDLSNGDEPVTTFVPYRGADGDGESESEGDGDGNGVENASGPGEGDGA
jgi:hypothetical protein